MYDHHLLDMAELAVAEFRPMLDFSDIAGGSAAESKPCLLFEGAEWEHEPNLQALRSIFIDFFQLRCVDAISSIGVEHVLCFTTAGGRIYLRHYLVRLLKSAEASSPHVKLTEMGPSLDLMIRRIQNAPPDLMKVAMKKPVATAAMPKKTKNVERSALHGRTGRLHMPRQDMSQLVTARMKGLGKRGRGSGEGARKKAKTEDAE